MSESPYTREDAARGKHETSVRPVAIRPGDSLAQLNICHWGWHDTGPPQATTTQPDDEAEGGDRSMAAEIVNLTPHEVRVVGWGEDIVYPPSGELARLATITLGTQRYEGIEAPVELVEFHHLTQEPPKVEGTWYIVSLPVALVAPRGDFLVPFDEVRDDNGRIIGCRLLGRPV